MSAERLREAARVLRERAEAATPGPWEATDSFGRDAGRAYVVPRDPETLTYVSVGGSPDEDCDAAYIATLHPGVGLALADLLDDQAKGYETWCETYGSDAAARIMLPSTRIADLILGGTQ